MFSDDDLEHTSPRTRFKDTSSMSSSSSSSSEHEHSTNLPSTLRGNRPQKRHHRRHIHDKKTGKGVINTDKAQSPVDHSESVGMKMMMRMGYRPGSGLGAD